MNKVLTLRDANQQFSSLVRAAEAGQEFLITRRGKAVARLIPAVDTQSGRGLSSEQAAALGRLRKRIGAGFDLSALHPVDRDRLHER
jgi:prevent-host-death family protein